MRLVNGSHPGAGKLEMLHNGVWGAVCGSFFLDSEAKVACRDLGFPTEEPVSKVAHIQANTSFVVTDISCEGKEQHILECRHSYDVYFCRPNDNVYLECTPPPSTTRVKTIEATTTAVQTTTAAATSRPETTPTIAETTSTVAETTPPVAVTTPTVAESTPTVAESTPTVAETTSTWVSSTVEPAATTFGRFSTPIPVASTKMNRISPAIPTTAAFKTTKDIDVLTEPTTVHSTVGTRPAEQSKQQVDVTTSQPAPQPISTTFLPGEAPTSSLSTTTATSSVAATLVVTDNPHTGPAGPSAGHTSLDVGQGDLVTDLTSIHRGESTVDIKQTEVKVTEKSELSTGKSTPFNTSVTAHKYDEASVKMEASASTKAHDAGKTEKRGVSSRGETTTSVPVEQLGTTPVRVISYPFSCNFDPKDCHFRGDVGPSNGYTWVTHSSQTIGPKQGNFIYLDNKKGRTSDTAKLLLGEFPLSQQGIVCFSFLHSMSGSVSLSISAYMFGMKGFVGSLTSYSTDDTDWKRFTNTIYPYDKFEIEILATKANDEKTGYVAIDDIYVAEGNCPDFDDRRRRR